MSSLIYSLTIPAVILVASGLAFFVLRLADPVEDTRDQEADGDWPAVPPLFVPFTSEGT